MAFDVVSIVNLEPAAGLIIVPGTKLIASLNGTSFFS